MITELEGSRGALRGQRVLVTGASGFLGSHLCLRLNEEGADVYAVSRSAHETEAGQVHWWRGDLTDVAAVRRILTETRPHVIFHLSGLVTAVCGLELVLPTLHSLLVSTVNILTVAVETGCGRVVLAGSLQEPIPNQDEPTPGSPYAAAKWAGSSYGRMFFKLYGLPVVNLRIFMTYGPGQEVGKLIPYVILSLLRQQAPKLSSATWEGDWVYIDDVIRALVAAAHVQGIAGTTIELGSGTLVSTRKIVEHLLELTRSRIAPEFGALPDRPLEHVRVADVVQTYRTLGWRPSISLIEGLQRTIDGYAQTIKDGLA